MQNATINVKTLLEKKDLLEKRHTKEFFVEVKDLGVFKFRTPTTGDILDSQTYNDGENDDEFIIYTCCIEPNLKDKELLEGYGVKEPVKIIEKLFLPGESKRIATLLIEAAGYKEEIAKVIDDTKN